jgi:hypothetical protein
VLRKTDGRVVATGPGEIAGWAGPHRIIVSYWDEPHWSGFIRIPKQFINEEITMIEWYYLLDLRTGKKHPLCRSYVFVDEGEH